jgi:hypothetical protein
MEKQLRAEMEDAAKTLEDLQEQLRVVNLKCGSFMRERDQWKQIAESRGEGSPGRRVGAAESFIMSRPATPVALGSSMGAGSLQASVLATTGPTDFETLYKDLQVFIFIAVY